LLTSCLLPHVDRQWVKRRVAERQQQSAQAAKEALLAAVTKVENEVIQ
jgi:hypothetical protein